MARTVLLAGATGAVGSAVLPRLVAAGHRVRTLSRRARSGPNVDARAADVTRPESLLGVADGCDVVISCLGASVGLHLGDRRGYAAVDHAGNANLLAAARAARVPRFVYCGVHVAPGYAHTHYVRAHEDFVAELRAAPIASTVVRPTGIFSAFAPFVGLARRGPLGVFGDGAARSNPVHADDVAEALLASLDSGPADLPVGGPDVLSRREIAELAFSALGRAPRIWRVPPLVPRLLSALLRIPHPRLSQLFEFVAAAFTSEAVAPALGRRRLADYFAELAAA